MNVALNGFLSIYPYDNGGTHSIFIWILFGLAFIISLLSLYFDFRYVIFDKISCKSDKIEIFTFGWSPFTFATNIACAAYYSLMFSGKLPEFVAVV